MFDQSTICIKRSIPVSGRNKCRLTPKRGFWLFDHYHHPKHNSMASEYQQLHCYNLFKKKKWISTCTSNSRQWAVGAKERPLFWALRQSSEIDLLDKLKTFTSSVCACVSCSGFLRELLLPLLHFLRCEKSLPSSGKSLKIRGTISCKTTNVIYMLRCPCGLGYVGKTSRQLKTRIAEHRCAIRHQDPRSPVEQHFFQV